MGCCSENKEDDCRCDDQERMFKALELRQYQLNELSTLRDLAVDLYPMITDTKVGPQAKTCIDKVLEKLSTLI